MLTNLTGLPLVFFAFILPSTIVLRRESPLIMWPNQFLCWLRIIPIGLSDHFSATIVVSLHLSIQLTISILRHIHVSKAQLVQIIR